MRPAPRSGRRWKPPATSISTAMRAGIRSATKPSTTRASWSKGRAARNCRRRARRSNGPPRKPGSSACPNIRSRCCDSYRDNPDFIRPESRRNEVMRFVEGGLKDLSVSRTSFDWGVPVPGSPGHVMYVWVDALTTYMTGVGFPEREGEFARFWPADVHLIGKDIVRFHAVYWPAFLMSAEPAAAQTGLRPWLHPRQGRREDVQVARQCRRPDGYGRALSASMRCAISCFARSASARMAATATKRSSTASTASSRTASAISPSAACR